MTVNLLDLFVAQLKILEHVSWGQSEHGRLWLLTERDHSQICMKFNIVTNCAAVSINTNKVPHLHISLDSLQDKINKYDKHYFKIRLQHDIYYARKVTWNAAEKYRNSKIRQW
jgi:hypothetical protein